MEHGGADTREEAEALLARIGTAGDGEIDIGEGALALAALDRPQVPLARYREHLCELSEEVRAQASASGAGQGSAQSAALARALFERMGYDGDRLTYDDLQNANLMLGLEETDGLMLAPVFP